MTSEEAVIQGQGRKERRLIEATLRIIAQFCTVLSRNAQA